MRPRDAPAPRRQRRLAWLALAAACVLLLGVLVRFALQPPRATAFLLDRIGAALDLEIRAEGGDYRLRGSPRLVLRNLVAREPGARVPLLRAERILLALPWSTVRSRGGELTVTRIELDAPHLDLPALQHWLATRPPGEKRIPTLTDGLQIHRGRIDNDDWRIDGIDVRLPALAPGRPLAARIRGRYLDPPIALPFDLAVALSRPDNDAGLGVAGAITLDRGAWRLPARVRLSGPLHIGRDELSIRPARLSASARYVSGATELPFALGLHGPLRFDEATWTLAPVAVALRGNDTVPTLDARGALALGHRLVLRLDGALAAWPATWPALPPPIGQSGSPLPFGLRYLGAPDLAAIAALRLQRDAARFDARFRLADVTAWLGQGDGGSPLPPLDGRLAAPALEISGARLEGVEVTLDDPELPDVDGTP